MFEWSVIWHSMPDLMQGASMTIKITFMGLLGGALIGFLSGVANTYIQAPTNIKSITGFLSITNLVLMLIKFISRLYVLVIRGTPIVVQVMFIYFALPLIGGWRIDALTAAVFTLMINSGAYISEIVRGALLSVPKGLIEAGQSMGLPFYKILIYIIGPVAFRRMIPAMGNQCIISLKDSSLFIVIGVAELTRQGQEIIASNFRSVEIWGAVAIIYLILNGFIALVLKLIERRMQIF